MKAPSVLEMMETIYIDLAHIPFGLAVRHPFGHTFAHAARMGQPGANRRPKPFDARGFTHDRVAIDWESENAIERAQRFFAAGRLGRVPAPVPRIG